MSATLNLPTHLLSTLDRVNNSITMRKLRDLFTFYDPDTRIWRGLPTPPLLNPDQSLGQLILGMLDRNRNKVVQISADSGVQITGAELHQRTIRVAQNLIKLGFGTRNPDDIFAMAVRNGEHAAPVMFACFALGIPVNTMDPSFQRDDLGHILTLACPKLVFCESDTLDELIPACAIAGIAPKVIVLGDKIVGYDHVDDLLVPTDIEDSFVPVHLNDPANEPAVLVCSSGSTGRSKAVCLSHSICIAHVASFYAFQSDDVVFAYSSLYWLSGLIMLVAGTAVGAKRIITREGFTVSRTLDLIQRFRITAMILPPSQAWAIATDPSATMSTLASLRLPMCGGSAVSAKLKESFDKLIPGRSLEVMYGFSEVSTAVAYTKGEFYRDGSVGFTGPRIEVKIVDENNCELGIGQEGEILVRTNYVFSGYHGNAAATKEMLDDEGWMHSGDIGRIDEDGLMYVVDRKKDLIKYKSFQISPSDIESVLHSICGGATVCVVGIPTETGDDLVTALIVRNSKSNLTSEFVLKEAEKKLPNYKQLRGGVHFVDKLPMTPSGKVVRRLAKEMVLKGVK